MFKHGAYEIDDDPARVALDAAWEFLSSDAYWARWRSGEDLRRQIEGAWRVVGCYAPSGHMVGFARALSDAVALAYLADVYVLREHRGHGLGEALLREMIDNGPGRDFRWMLHTCDAHHLHRKFGFSAPDPTYMERPRRMVEPRQLLIRPWDSCCRWGMAIGRSPTATPSVWSQPSSRRPSR